MAKISKRRQAFAAKVDRQKLYPIDDALALVKECASAKFDESIDVAVQLGIDAKKSDQVVRGSVVLPAGTGKSVRVAVFAQGEKLSRHAPQAPKWSVWKTSPSRSSRPNGLRYRDRFAGHDAYRRYAGSDPRPARPDAEPEGWHGHAGRRDRGEEREGWPGAVPRRQGRHHSRDDRPCVVRADRAAHEPLRADRSAAEAKPATSKGVYLRKIALSSTMGVGVRVDQGSLAAQ